MTGTDGQRAAVVFWKRYVSDPAVMYEQLNDRSRAMWDEIAKAAAADATAQRDKLREGIAALLADITKSANATRPSKKTALEDEFAIALRKLLETP